MNLLNCDLPEAVAESDGGLTFDTDDMDGTGSLMLPKAVYPISTDYRTIVDIMMMYEDADLTEQEKTVCMLRMLYLDNIPEDINAAAEMAMAFLNCGEESAKQPSHASGLGRLFSWKQDGNFIYAAINQSHNDILDRVPNLHWWKFVNCLQNLKEDCRFNEIICNRAAHKKGKATKEQKQARRDYPHIYVLRTTVKHDDRRDEKLREIERLLNS